MLQLNRALFLLPLLLVLEVARAQEKVALHPALLEVRYFVTHGREAAKIPQFTPGIGVGYLRGLGRKVDGSLQGAGTFADSLLQRGGAPGARKLLLAADLSVRARPLSPKNRLQPFAAAGLGASFSAPTFGLFVPAALGVQARWQSVYLVLHTGYRQPLTGHLQPHFYHSLGIAGRIGRKDKKRLSPALTATPPPPERPQAAGPPPDSDNDGLPDGQDACPHAPGLARLNGCPPPDSDGDGLNDEEDLCPNRTGARGQRGCPAVERHLADRVDKAARNIFFPTNRYDLLPASLPALQEVVQLLTEEPGLHLLIEGYTDSRGSDALNQPLSENRARAVLQYVTGKGIDKKRLKAVGYGNSRPAESNERPEGRRKNRRVELLLYYAG
ncbi:OmpA family protein [Paraflavisolibacter sp. H34]|uniref:OmpA family protein n=1 Tax=Huijunlia imazamoxiresistens TaxID=3127457 RepID=UPI0030180F03